MESGSKVHSDASEAFRQSRRVTVSRGVEPVAHHRKGSGSFPGARPISTGADLYESFIRCCEAMAQMLAGRGGQ
jgi:hypothetical protein